MSKPLPPKYQTISWQAYNQSLKQRGQLLLWLNKDTDWLEPATGRRGRQPTFSDAAIQFCLTIKCLFGLALRQATGMVESMLRLAGLDWAVPDFSTLSRRQKDLQVRIPVQKKQGCLHLLVDSTGIKMMGEGEWKVKKHGADYRRQWRKLHLGIDAQTLEIRAMEVTDNRTGDARVAIANSGDRGTGDRDYGWGVRHTSMSRSDCGAGSCSHHSPAMKRPIL